MFAGGAMRGREHMNPFREKWGKMSNEERREVIRKQHFFHNPFDGFHEGSPPDPNDGKEKE
jgi:hypothetical protein